MRANQSNDAEQLASLEQRARELLAAEYERSGYGASAEGIRLGDDCAHDLEAASIRAITAALSAQPRGARKWTPEDIQTFARGYKKEVPHAVLTVHGINAGLDALTATTPQDAAAPGVGND